MGRVIGEKQNVRISSAGFLEYPLAADLQFLDEVTFAGKGEFSDNPLRERDQERIRLGRNKAIGEIFKFQHPAHHFTCSGHKDKKTLKELRLEQNGDLRWHRSVQVNWILRPARREDGPGLVRLVDEVYQEYGDEADVEGYDRDLLDVDAAYRAEGGEFVVLEKQGEIVGAHATQPIDREQGLLTFRRLYLPESMRGTGAGKVLMDWAIKWSREHNFTRVEFWSDTRFARAHRFFEGYGFVRGGTREVVEGKLTFSEFHYGMDL